MEKTIILVLLISSLIIATEARPQLWNNLWKGWLLWKRPFWNRSLTREQAAPERGR